MIGGKLSNILSEDFLYYVAGESGYDSTVSFFLSPNKKADGLESLYQEIYIYTYILKTWCLGTFIKNLLSANYCSEHFACTNSQQV